MLTPTTIAVDTTAQMPLSEQKFIVLLSVDSDGDAEFWFRDLKHFTFSTKRATQTNLLEGLAIIAEYGKGALVPVTAVRGDATGYRIGDGCDCNEDE